MMRSVAAFTPPFARLLHRLAVVFLACLIAGCSLLPEVKDETAGWSASKLYNEARDAQADGAWEKAAKLLEKLEARFPYGRYAQQAQLELGYVYWKGAEPLAAIAACDPAEDLRGDIEYKTAMAGEMVKRALAKAWAMCS